MGTIDLGIAGLEPAELVGRGGNAIVYRARQSDLDRDVAVKLLHGHPDAASNRRFERERRIMASIPPHPAIAPIFSSGQTATGEAYLVMPFYGAGSLADEPTTNWRVAVGDMIQVANAVDHAHRHGVLHRDLKPANIMRNDDGSPVIVDFGIASLVDGTRSEALSLTPAYAPPEAFADPEPGPNVDIYGLGATLHGLLVGQDPFDLKDIGFYQALKKVQLEAPTPIGSHVPESVRRIAERAMAKDPEHRYANPAAMAHDLSRVLEDPAAVIVVPAESAQTGQPASQPWSVPGSLAASGVPEVAPTASNGDARSPRSQRVGAGLLLVLLVGLATGGFLLLDNLLGASTTIMTTDGATPADGSVPEDGDDETGSVATAAGGDGATPVGDESGELPTVDATPGPSPVPTAAPTVDEGCLAEIPACLGEPLTTVVTARGLADRAENYFFNDGAVAERAWNIPGGGEYVVWALEDELVQVRMSATNLRELAGRPPIDVEAEIALLDTTLDEVIAVRGEPFLFHWYELEGGTFPYVQWCATDGTKDHVVEYESLVGNDNESLVPEVFDWLRIVGDPGPEPPLQSVVGTATIGSVTLTSPAFLDDLAACAVTGTTLNLCADVDDALNIRSGPGLEASAIHAIAPQSCSIRVARDRAPELVSEDGLVWVQVFVDEVGGRIEGWVAARFLVDEEP